MQVNLLEAINIIKSDSENIVRVIESYGIEFEHGMAKCPFHNDNTPSMSTKAGKFKCFTKTCEASGDALDFVSRVEGLNILDSAKKCLELLSLPYTIEKDKLDNLKEWIEKNNPTHYKDNSFKLEDIHFYRDENNEPKLARIKYKNKETGKKKYSQANIVDAGEFYKLDYTSEKINLIYNMPKVIKSIQENKYIFITEGEKDADNLIRLGLTATTCREVTSASSEVLKPLFNANVVVIGDNDKVGQAHVKNIRYLLKGKSKSFRELRIKEMNDICDKADISDYIHKKLDDGLTSKDIRCDILDRVDRTLDECNKHELQQDRNGIYKTWMKPVKIDGEDSVEEVKIYITNFNVKGLTRIENVDTDEEEIELKIVSNLGEYKVIKGRSNKVFLDPKSFNSCTNMGFFFDGKPKDLNMFKAWVNRYFLDEKRNEYLLTGIREIDGKKMLVTPEGGLLEDGKIDTNYKADNHITQIDYTSTKRLDKEAANELAKHLFKFNTNKNCYNIIGSLVSNMFNSIYRDAKGINVHVTSYVGESGSGKSFTIDNITRPLLGLDNDTMVFSSIMPHGLLRAMNDTYMPTIIDEVKPSQAGEFKRQLLSNTIRSVTGESTVIKGTQNQSIKTYKYNSSLVIAGEEVLDETALKNRCNIIWFSCNELNESTMDHGSYFLTKEGKEALKSLGMEIYLYIMKTFDADKLVKVLSSIEESFKGENNIAPRIQATFNNTMLGYITVKHVLNSIGADTSHLENDYSVSRLIYQNLQENVLDGEFATKQIYDEVLEAIDELASGTHQYAISEDCHFKQDSLYLKLDFKNIFPVLESYYRSRGKTLKIDCKTFIKMITKTKYVQGTNKDYYKSVRLGEKVRKVYFITKDAIKHLDMPTLNPNNEVDWDKV